MFKKVVEKAFHFVGDSIVAAVNVTDDGLVLVMDAAMLGRVIIWNLRGADDDDYPTYP